MTIIPPPLWGVWMTKPDGQGHWRLNTRGQTLLYYSQEDATAASIRHQDLAKELDLPGIFEPRMYTSEFPL